LSEILVVVAVRLLRKRLKSIRLPHKAEESAFFNLSLQFV
jgi:hypothetical protein